jgi:hypothetical protein
MLNFDNQKAKTRGAPAHHSSRVYPRHSFTGYRERFGKLLRKPIDNERDILYHCLRQ